MPARDRAELIYHSSDGFEEAMSAYQPKRTPNNQAVGYMMNLAIKCTTTTTTYDCTSPLIRLQRQE